MKSTITLLFAIIMTLTLHAQQRVAGPSKDIHGSRSSISVSNHDGSSVTSSELVEAILGPGITYSNVSFTGLSGGGAASAGLFAGGSAAGLGFESGIVLSSGYVHNAIGPNNSGNTSAALGLAGDPDLATLSGHASFDATVLEFDFTLPADSINIQFLFGSEEYLEWVGSQYDDAFAFFIDGVNIALVPGTNDPVTVNSINPGSNSAYYVDNGSGFYDVEMDGFTTLLQASAALNSNPVHHIKLVIGDSGDNILDAWVFIRESSFSIPIEVDLGPDVTVCEDEVVVLDAANSGYAYSWSTGETTQTISVSTSGTYWVEVSYLGNTGSDTVEVTFAPLPVANAGPDQLIYIGYPPLSAQLSATGGVTYSWSPADGLSDASIADPIAQPDVTTTYTVTVTDANDCTDTDEVTVEVMDIRCGNNMNKVLVCHVPPGNPENAKTLCVSPNAVPALLAQGSHLGPCDNGKSGSIDEIAANGIGVNVYPNPMNNECSIEIAQEFSNITTITITDILGRTISTLHKGQLDAGIHNFNWSVPGDGNSIYFLKVISGAETITTKLMVN